VVLTFDDGPLPRYSNQILEILASQCVKATFFTVGRMARSSPEGVRRLREAGHSIGTHTQDHPQGMKRMSIERARLEIDDGIASVTAVLGEGAPAPFFRIPGLSRADGVEDYLASLGIQIWSADFPADDWRHVSSSRVYDLAIRRLEDKGKGILLLHDIQPRTVTALPRILNALKARGYRIVHVVPATPEQIATPTEPQQWQLHPPSENVAISHWPKIPKFVFADAGMLPAPALSDLDLHDGPLVTLAESFDRVTRLVRGVPLPREAPWPRQLPLAQADGATALPVPAESIFEIREGLRAAVQAGPPARHAEQVASVEAGSRRTIRGRPHLGRARQHGVSHLAGRGGRQVGHARKGTLKHLVQVKKRSV
jgi:peptidoglycan-N-acetylglucosamine deacetylase